MVVVGGDEGGGRGRLLKEQFVTLGEALRWKRSRVGADGWTSRGFTTLSRQGLIRRRSWSGFSHGSTSVRDPLLEELLSGDILNRLVSLGLGTRGAVLADSVDVVAAAEIGDGSKAEPLQEYLPVVLAGRGDDLVGVMFRLARAGWGDGSPSVPRRRRCDRWRRC